MTQTQTPFGEPGISVTDESIQATASFSEAFNDLAVLRLVDEPLQEPFRLSDLTHELCQHIEREYARALP